MLCTSVDVHVYAPQRMRRGSARARQMLSHCSNAGTPKSRWQQCGTTDFDSESRCPPDKDTMLSECDDRLGYDGFCNDAAYMYRSWTVKVADKSERKSTPEVSSK